MIQENVEVAQIVCACVCVRKSREKKKFFLLWTEDGNDFPIGCNSKSNECMFADSAANSHLICPFGQHWCQSVALMQFILSSCQSNFDVEDKINSKIHLAPKICSAKTDRNFIWHSTFLYLHVHIWRRSCVRVCVFSIIFVQFSIHKICIFLKKLIKKFNNGVACISVVGFVVWRLCVRK